MREGLTEKNAERLNYFIIFLKIGCDSLGLVMKICRNQMIFLINIANRLKQNKLKLF